MRVVNIFLTNEIVESFEDLSLGDHEYVFGQIDQAGPRRLVEGSACIFVDWVMPDMAGLEMCRRLRASDQLSDAHITMVLEEDDAEDRRRALKAGADDYVVGPIDRTVVLDRVMAVHGDLEQRSSADLIERGPLTINLASLQARWNDEPLPIRPNEFRLLRFFAENPDRVLTRQQLIDGLGKREPAIDERTVDVWIGRLRRAFRKVGAGDILRTVRSIGYVFDTP
ncbi:response regulator transcription factor [Erythrobacter sp. W53]|uniref:response regulator transcription factor n=1 Tax=Erythrobacter sp. W53 TaxID=3425947 RepID=UPI003D7682CB